MKKLLLLSATLIALFLTACSENSTVGNYDETEFIQVTLSANSFVSVADNAFRGKSVEFDESYSHPLPETFTAYLVAKEKKGQYNPGDLIQTEIVGSGANSLTVPKMKMTIYVTNYEAPATLSDVWYTFPDAVQQLPRTSDKLYLYGKNIIDFNTSLTGEVDVQNPYAAVMIRNNNWLSGAPKSYDSDQYYTLVSDDWYNLYIRSNNTNTMVPLNVTSGSLTLKRDIVPNRIYQFIFNGDVATDTGNLTVNVGELEKGSAEEIDI